MSEMKIGWATRDITPEGTVRVMGQFHVRVSTHVENPLSCTALAIDGGDGTGQAVLLSVDGPYVTDEIMQECRRRVADEMPGLDPHDLCVFTTHTHTAPCQSNFWYPDELPEGVSPAEEYADMLTDRMTEAIGEAWNARGPAQVSWGWAQAVIAHNRRINYEDGSGRLYGPTATTAFSHIEGTADHTVNLLFTYDPKGDLSGIVVNIPCPSQTREGESFLSADYWHETREELRRRYGNDIFILPQCGFSGDQSPHIMLHRREHLRMLRLKGMIPPGTTADWANEVTLAECRLIAERIAAAVDEVSAVCETERTGDAPFAHSYRVLDLPRRMVTAEEARMYAEEAAAEREQLATLSPDPADPVYTSCHSRIVYNEKIAKRYKEQLDNPTYPAEVHVLRIGDMAMTFACFELYLDFSLRIQERSPAVQTFTIQLLAQDTDNPGAYLPTERAVKAGDYGGNVRDNTVGPEGGRVLVDSVVTMLNEIWEAQ